jgi:heptosyltransferase-1
LNILLVRVSSLGDVLHNLPVVADILRHHPDAKIDWVVEEGYVSLVRLNPNVRRVIPFALRRWRKGLFNPAVRAEVRNFFRTLREEPYDFVFDTQGRHHHGRGARQAGRSQGGTGQRYRGVGLRAAVARLP